MPRKAKRKFFGGKSSNSNKSVKLDESASKKQEHNDESDSRADTANLQKEQAQQEEEEDIVTFERHQRTSSVTNDSTFSGGQLDIPDTSITKMGGTMSCAPSPSLPARKLRWCSEPNLNKSNSNAFIRPYTDADGNQKATITLKFIQFIGEIPKDTRDTQSVADIPESDRNIVAERNESMSDDIVIEDVVKVRDECESILSEKEELDAVPKLDHFVEEEVKQQSKIFDDNYRVESPKQNSAHAAPVPALMASDGSKRHAMLIQEISESSSSEEVKQFLDNDVPIVKTQSQREYRVDSPESSDASNNDIQQSQTIVLPEIMESSSNESVTAINIKELPSESSNDEEHTPSTTKIKLFECKTEKKLNKAEEAIIEALYGNSNLLQIPNTPLDVISEEGSDCSDIERAASKLNDNKPKLIPVIDDYEVSEENDVFTSEPGDVKFYRYRTQQPRIISVEQPKLINTKIIETETNVPESCKKWQTKQSDSELQAELVYLTSASSSATDLSERSTDTEDHGEDNSEDTETNSLLESISVPSLYNVNDENEARKHEHVIDDEHDLIQQESLEMNEQKLPDILEEEEHFEIIQSQQQIEDVNKELHHLDSESKITVPEATNVVITCDDKKTINDTKTDLNNNTKSGTPTPTQARRKYSSDSSTSSTNSQCTIIRQVPPIDNNSNVHALKELCMQSINEGSRFTVQKKLNSLSRNAPSIPIINELELHYECDNNNNNNNNSNGDLQGRENSKGKDKVITILQVPPEMNNQSTPVSTSNDERWFALQSTQMPNVMLALSPRQKDYMLNTQQHQQQKQQQYSQDSTPYQSNSADVLLDMHKKFVERRAYHEEDTSRVMDESKNSDKSQAINVCQLEESNLSDSSGSAIKSISTGDDAMDAIRNLIKRESASVVNGNNDFHVKKYELESELQKLDSERKELEEELRNIQSLQHFKREEFLYNQKKLLRDEESSLSDGNNVNKYANDDFNDFINSNEKLHKEIYNEWQDKVCERNERKLQKALKITRIDDDEMPERPRERAASERYVQLNDEFLEKVKERQKRLSLPLDDNLDASTESLLNDGTDEGTLKKRKKKVFHFVDNKENFPTHFREFIDYCEQEIVQTKSSVESATSNKKMDNRNYVNSDSHTKLLREKTKRESKITKVQTKMLQQLPQKPLCPKKPKKLSEKWLKPPHNQKPDVTNEWDLDKNISVSGNDLLSEIDKSLKGDAKGFVLKTGIWSEQNHSQDSIQKKLDSPPPAPVWSPKSAPPSPTAERKFRPVPFESPTLARKKLSTKDCPSPPPWTSPDYSDKPYQSSIIKSSSLNTISSSRSQPQQQPNHNIFRKAKADQFNEKFDKGTSQNTSARDKLISFKPTPLKSSKSNELVYSIKQHQQRDSEVKDSDINNNSNNISESTISTAKTTTTSKKMSTQQQSSPKKIDGIGPTTQSGMPLSLRSEVTDMNRDQWYKKMYNTIHKAKDDENYVTVKYKTKRGIPYKSNGYASEPDTNYDSDYIVKYSSGASSDRQRTVSIGNQSDDRYGSMEQPVKPIIGQYKVQPGRIENYTPGKSSVSDKEAKQWWDDIMDIFDGWLDEHSSKPLCGIKLAKEVEKFHLEQQKLASNYTQGNLSRALKEQGYQSDSTLVFKKKNDVEQLSPVEQKMAYKSFQHGGEVPLHGFRKNAPEKPKDGDDVDEDGDENSIRKYNMKLPHDERAIINSEIICYPITNISRPLDMFGPFPKNVKSFVPVVPPQPPNRKSSRTNSTLKIVSHLNTKSPRTRSCAKHDSMNVKFSTSSNSKKTTELNRSRSAGPSFISTYVSSSSRNDERWHDSHHTRMAKRICYRASSSSPIRRKLFHERKASQSPVAFGRGLSKERAFAEEKKKVEEKLAKISKDLHVSTRILRNPDLRSPNEVKQAVQQTFKPITCIKDPRLASLMMRKSLETQAFQSKKSEQKSLKVTVAISSRGRELLRTSTETAPRSLRQASNVSTLSSKSSTLTKSAASDIITAKNKLKMKSKGSVMTSSNNSLARTNSTYSIDSTMSKRKTPLADLKICRNAPVTITSQKLKKSSSSSSSKLSDKGKTVASSDGVEKKEEKQQKTLFHDPTVDDNRKVVESINQTIVHQNEAIRTDSFFQNLFLRDNLKKYGAPINPTSSVAEKARLWNALASYKSEPSLRQPNHYLHQSRLVSHSKFREIEKRNESEECYAIFNRPINDTDASSSKGGFVMEQIYKYDSLYQLSDEDEFGNSNRGRSLDFSYSYHERSNSEPPNKTLMTEFVRPHSPVIIYGRNKSVETEKRQRSSRSPSCRRIQNLKTNKLMELSSYQKEIVRAQSVGRTDRAKEKLNERASSNLYRSKSLNILNYERHLPICGHKKSERFRDLKDFYTCLERIGQLECATSNSDLRPCRRNEDIIDYDLWQKVREYEKNERELNILLKKLRTEQRDKDFLFQPHSADEFRWTADADLGLVTKEKSVENLKELFKKKSINDDNDDDESAAIANKAVSKEKGAKGKSNGKKSKKNAFDGTKDNYKPLWRASSVLDLASNMTKKFNKNGSKKPATANTLPKAEKHEKNLGLSRKLLSTLSKDQLKKIKNQLTEIYSSNEKATGDANDNLNENVTVASTSMASHMNNNIEAYVVTVPPKQSPFETKSEKSFLTVRSHSELTKDQIQEPTVDISTLKNVFENKSPSTVAPSEISESEKRSISQTLCQEIKDKFNQQNNRKKKNPDIERVKKIENAIKSNKTLPAAKIATAVKRDISFSFHEAPPAASKYLVDCLPTKSSATGTESISSETSNRTVIFRENGTTMEDVHAKIKYFEEIEKEKDKVPVTIYHARDDSSPDEEDNGAKKEKIISQDAPAVTPSVIQSSSTKMVSSQSFTDLKDLFGERSSMKSNTTFRSSNENFGESRGMLMKRSRSTSPCESDERCYKSLSEFGDVEKLKMRFENFSLSGAEDESSCHYIFSDSELNKASTVKQKTHIRGHEYGNVSHITHKYEMQSKRARRTRRTSPILKQSMKKKDDRLMPHINIISKTASLKDRQRMSVSNKDSLDKIEAIPSTSGEVVARIKHKFETLDSNLSLMGKMYTSVPDFRELNDLSPHLSHLPYCGNFVSHQYPRPEDNNRSINSPDKSRPGIKPRKRPSSTSPIRKDPTITSVTKQLREIFSDDQSFDRSVRNRNRHDAEYLWHKKQFKSSSSSVSYKVDLVDSFTYSPRTPSTPPLVPPKNNYNLNGYYSDSQKKYVENDVNIHYKVPVRYEFKHAIPDDELARQQAEHMKKVYQEERRRKYLQELQDMNNRRHTDNFTPSQKSPIALNRYDDFAYNIPPPLSKSPVNLPGTIARALYSFQGQSSRELSFKKGDIIYIRRQIDKNWYEGEHNAMIGLLPVQYVDIISNDGIRPLPMPIKKPSEGQARAKYNFIAQSDIELSLNKGELVSLTRRVDPNWFEGRIGNRKGIFPVSYVDVLTDIGSEDLENNIVTTTTTTVTKFIPSSPSPISDVVRETKTIRKTEVLHVDTANDPITYRAMYNYRPVNSDELELREGDLIYVLEQCDDGWFVGTNSRTGFFGTFPGNYSKRVFT